jgi:hypothetical protein
MVGNLNTSTLALRAVEGDEKAPGAWGHNWTSLSLRYINTGTWFSRLGVRCKAANLVLLKIVVVNSNEVKIGSNLTESSMEG